MWNRALPPVLAKLHELEFDYADGEGIDFEPYEEFLSPDDNVDWFRAWTGNQHVDGIEFRVFGQDGSGGYAAFWLKYPERELEAQPIVFLGSEGELGVVAESLDQYLWLLAAGLGPHEAIAYPDVVRNPNPHFTKFARANSRVSALPAAQVTANASATSKAFAQHIESLLR